MLLLYHLLTLSFLDKPDSKRTNESERESKDQAVVSPTSSALVANAVLFLSSCMCLRKTPRRLKYARMGFKLYFLTSSLGLISYMSGSDSLTALTEIVWVWCYILGVPLLASDLVKYSPSVPDITPFHMVIPAYTLLTFHTNPDSLDGLLLAISHTISVLFLAAASVSSGNLTGYALAFVHFFAMFRPCTDSSICVEQNIYAALIPGNLIRFGLLQEKETSHVFWLFMMTLANAFYLKVIEGDTQTTSE